MSATAPSGDRQQQHDHDRTEFMPAQNNSAIRKILPLAMFLLAGMRLAAHLHWPPIVTAVILAIVAISALAAAHLLKSKVPNSAGSVVAKIFKPISVIWLGLIVL